MGLPVIAPNSGAINERMGADKGGWLVDFSSADEIWSILNSLMNKKELFNNALHNISRINLRSDEDMIQDYIKLYHQLKPPVTAEL